MSSNKTEHLQLHQWESGDDFSRTEINENFAAIDGAVGEAARLAVGSYVGTGTYGAGNPNRLTFDFTPRLVFIRAILMSENGAGDHKYCDLMLHNPSTKGFGTVSTSATNWPGSPMFPSSVEVTWGEKSVSWYHPNLAGKQGNFEGITYIYWALA